MKAVYAGIGTKYRAVSPANGAAGIDAIERKDPRLGVFTYFLTLRRGIQTAGTPSKRAKSKCWNVRFDGSNGSLVIEQNQKTR
jgi:hypothetical protein